MASRLCYIAEWLDSASGVVWKYQLFYYPESKEVEMVDIKNRKHFLKKIRPPPDFKEELLYLNSTVTLYSRQLKLVAYGDEFTRSKMQARHERTLAMVKPDAYKHLGKIINAIQRSGFMINNLRVCKLSKTEAQTFYEVHRGKPFYDTLTDFMSSGRICAMELTGPSAIDSWRQLLGPTDSDVARQQAPDSIRASFGTNKTYNACHGSDAPDTAAQELAFFFGKPGSAAVGKCDLGGRGTTLGIVKPHVLLDCAAGLLLDCVMENFEITAMEMFKLEKSTAAEFYEVYKGVLSPGEFSAITDELTSGPCIAFEVADRDGADSVEPFRQLCGPLDPELARVLRPNSLRALFGLNKVKNGVHCTDLQVDGPLEVNYFFAILQS
mmetsp:Transcript_14303/g.38796  ORF Transcript_14303/g.38796 Transcript_14303/m.38796 type:complete len:381 (+) Transcript_14303:202-1344(+)|eukprot:CAMPEP_0202353386 /NCGR_PEP_ID=MMETSP1126-20121109/9170_1 /ASSEMBLY_ACC=CAM_ASM_000457 /TAXON_ID=3047 /ORGANISM="Dunaliella tertiolecta, Strain CCMP1320" /LENGTH=380 /DNA_ID=CAMNT_0048945729 /DNA_START=138 /DNA_END=1280 /DNA_ORIENTATION=-